MEKNKKLRNTQQQQQQQQKGVKRKKGKKEEEIEQEEQEEQEEVNLDVKEVEEEFQEEKDDRHQETIEKDSYGNEIFTTSYLGKATRKVELLSRIKILHETLKNLDEIGNKKKILISISGQLNSNKLIGNPEKEIRLLSAACILDILRLFAPDVPYSSEELCELFEAITIMIRGFSTYDPNSNLGTYLFYILSSLSTVRSCAILVFLAQQNIPNAIERLKEFLEALISSIRPDHSEAVVGHFGNILEVCIFESEKFDQEILDTLLSPLLPSSKTENPAAYHLSQSVLSRCVSKLQPFISNFINHILVGGIQDITHLGSDESNLSEDIYVIIYEISKISPSYLLHILPNICIKLQAEEPEIRLEVVKVLGRIFASPHSNYGKDFSKSFKEFVGRFVDISTPIRIDMVESGFLIFVHHPELRESIEDNLCKRLRDAEVQVRYTALSRLLEILSEDPTQLQVFTIKEIAERVKDKKQEVRKIAQIGLSKVYSRHISHQVLLGDAFGEIFEDDYDLESEEHLDKCFRSYPLYDINDPKERRDFTVSESLNINPEIWKRLEFVPGYILNCWGYPDPIDKHLVLQLFQEHILPKPRKDSTQEEDSAISRITSSVKRKGQKGDDIESSSMGKIISLARKSKTSKEALEWECRRATLLLRIFCSLDSTQRACLCALLLSKAKVRIELSEFTLKWTKSSKGSQNEMQRASFRLLQNFPPSLASIEKKTAALPIPMETLYQSKDKTLQKLLLLATEAFPRENTSRFGSRKSGSEEDILTITQSCAYRDELKQRLDSKSPLGNYVARIFDTSAVYMLANTWTVKYLFFHLVSSTRLLFHEHHIKATSGKQREKYQNYILRECCDTAELLSLFSKYIPIIFGGCAQDIEEWLHSICTLHQEEAHFWSSSHRTTLLSHLKNIVKYASKHLHESCNTLHIDEKESESAVRSLSSHLISYSSDCQNPLLCEMLAETVNFIIKAQHSTSGESDQSAQLCDEFGVTAALKKLCASQRLSVNAPCQRLSCDLHTIAALLNAYGQSARELSGISSRILQFLTTILFDNSSAFHMKENSNKKSESVGPDYYLLCLVGGIKVWLQLSIRETYRESLALGISGLHGSDEAVDTGKETGSDDWFAVKESQSIQDRFPAYLVEFLELLFSSIKSYGAKILDIQIVNSDRQSQIREVSTICLIKMLAIKSVGKGISIEEWKTLSWSFLDDNEQCRQNIFQAFSTLIQTHCIHPRFLAIPCLLASDPSLSSQANQSLLFTIRRLNRTHIDLCERAIEAQESNSVAEKENYIALAKVNSPECILPYLIYLLSYHPDFPASIDLTSEGDEERLRILYRSIKMMYSVILQAVGSDNNTLSILLKQVQMIFQFYSDRQQSASSWSLQFVLQVALHVLEGYIKTQIQPYSGDINLPMDLYVLTKSNRRNKFDENSMSRAFAVLSKLEGQRAKHPTLIRKKSPEKVKKPGKKKETKKRESTPDKERKRSSASLTARPRRGATSVSYADTRDSDDEAEMEEIEEILDQSQLSSYSSQRGKRSLSSGSRQSLESTGSGSIASERLSLGSAEESSSTFAKRRKLSGGLSQLEESTPSNEEEEEEEEFSLTSTSKSRSTPETEKKKSTKKVAPQISTKKSSRGKALESNVEDEVEESSRKSQPSKGKTKGKEPEKNRTLLSLWANQQSSQKSSKQTSTRTK